MAVSRWACVAFVVGVSFAGVSLASAKPGEPGAQGHGDEKHDHDRDGTGEGRAKGEADRDGGHRGEHGKGEDRDSDRDKDRERIAGEARDFRRKLFDDRQKTIIDILNRDHRELTDDGREAIRRHWRHLAELTRIRELALVAKDAAAVERVDRDIDREEKAFATRLDKLRDKADAAGGAK